MTQDIAPEVLAFLEGLPSSRNQVAQSGELTKEDEQRIKTMLRTSGTALAQADREALRRYILNLKFTDTAEISDADRKVMAEYLKNHAPEFYRLLLKPTP